MKRKIPILINAIALFFAVVFTSCQQEMNVTPDSNSPTSNTSDRIDPGLFVPVGGNSYLTKKSGAGGEIISPKGLFGWTGKDATVSTYFFVRSAGQLYLSLRASVPSGVSSVSILVNGQTFTVSNLSGTEYKIYRIGSINVTTPGYVKVDMEGLSNTSNGVFANVSDFVISGDAVSIGAYFANDAATYSASRSGAAVSLKYLLPTGLVDAQWFYNEITVPKGCDKLGTNFISNGFSNGYAGLQIDNSGARRMMLFVKDNGANLTRVDVKSRASLIDPTYSGGKFVYLPYDWKSGTTYKFITNAKTDGSGNSSIAMWVYTPEDAQWKFVASCIRVNSTTLITDIYSSIQGTNHENGHEARRMRCYNQWVNNNGTWSEVVGAMFVGDATATNLQRMDVAANVEASSFNLTTQGFFSNYVPLNTDFKRAKMVSQPSVDLTTLP